MPELIELARAQFPQADVQEKAKAADIYAFIIDRLRAYLRDQSVAGKAFTSAEIDAVLSQDPGQINDLILWKVFPPHVQGVNNAFFISGCLLKNDVERIP